MVSQKSFPHPLVGEEVEVYQAQNKHLLGLKGVIVDETKSTLKIKDEQGELKILLKKGITIKLTKKNQLVGQESLAKRMEERIKG
ncbi:ribonuclease P protein subunit [Candidatus Woesearchaeota archaeon]|nr:ribonuclease P protein subunit [Candidatus Woesearchaeota archaeon]